MKWMLIAAGIYNLAFGIFAIAFPNSMFHVIDMEPPKYPELWQCIGMIVGVYDVGYTTLASFQYSSVPDPRIAFFNSKFYREISLNRIVRQQVIDGITDYVLKNVCS